MEHQLTVRLPGKLAGRLDQFARDSRRKRSEVVRLALEQYLGGGASPGAARPVERLHDLFGSYESGLPDLGGNHREQLLGRLARGEEVFLENNGQPVAKLVALATGPRKPGSLKGKLKMSKDFDDPLPAEIARAFAGEAD